MENVYVIIMLHLNLKCNWLLQLRHVNIKTNCSTLCTALLALYQVRIEALEVRGGGGINIKNLCKSRNFSKKIYSNWINYKYFICIPKLHVNTKYFVRKLHFLDQKVFFFTYNVHGMLLIHSERFFFFIRQKMLMA